MNFENERYALVTGAAGGLGKIIAEALISRGFYVIGTDIQEENCLGQEYLSKLKRYYPMDLGNMDSLKSRIEQILGDFGRIDILINNAGMKSFKPFEEYAFDDIEKITKVNFISHALICKIVLPIMKKNAYGRIINISSSAAYYGYKNGAIYCSTKSALKIFTEALSQELVNFNVTINAICPQTIAIPEYLKENPSCKRGNLIKPETITRRILRLIDSGANGEVVPIISFTNKIRYFYYDIKKIYKWLF